MLIYEQIAAFSKRLSAECSALRAEENSVLTIINGFDTMNKEK